MNTHPRPKRFAVGAWKYAAKKWVYGLTVPALLVAGPVSAIEEGRSEASCENATRSSPGLGKKLLWYIPNRVMDLLDIFRFRLRAGPGLAAHVRVTDYGSFYSGSYDAVYMGLPGARHEQRVRSPMGRESLTGFIIAGVDATDDTPYGPEYDPSEINAGIHVGLAGIEIGINPVEIWDFVAGLFLFDPMNDDYPRDRKARTRQPTSGLSIGPGEGLFELDPKPERFDSWGDRLDYLETNVPRRVSEPLRAADAYFALDPDDPLVPPQSRLRLKLFSEVMRGHDFTFRLEPDVELDVEFPNIERRIRLFVETARADVVHGHTYPETEERGINIGMRKWIRHLHVSTDIGVRVSSWTPQPFARMVWARNFEPNSWQLRPVQRFVLNYDDGLACVSTLHVNRWLGENRTGVFSNTVSGKWSTENPSWKWSEKIAVTRVNRLLDERRRGRMVSRDETARATGLHYVVFGHGENVTKHRAGLFLRRPLYKQWVYGELRSGMEWDRADDFNGAFFVRMGVDLLFWGTARE